MLCRGENIKKKRYFLKKLLVVDMRMLNASGIGRYIQNLVQCFAAKRSFDIICLGHSKDLIDINRFSDVKYIHIKARIFSIEEQFELPLKIPRCDLYWSPQFNVPVLPILAKSRIVTIPDVFHLAYYNDIPFINRIYAKYLIKQALRLSDKVVTISNFTKNEILKYADINESKIDVIYCAVDDAFNQNFEKKEVSDKYILFVGNVKPHKNLLNALLAYKKIFTKYGIKFYIVGKREGFITGCKDLSHIINELQGEVVFTGHVSDDELKNYYYNAKLFILPSYYEGFGIPILEAMKFGLPVIASNAASIPEVGGNAIVYFDPYNIDDIADKMEKSLTGFYRFDRNLYASQLSKFSWANSAEAYIDLFEKIAGKKQA